MEAIRDKSSPRFHLLSPLLHLMLPRFDRQVCHYLQSRPMMAIDWRTNLTISCTQDSQDSRLPRWPSRVPYVFFLYFFNIFQTEKNTETLPEVSLYEILETMLVLWTSWRAEHNLREYD